MTLQLQDKWIWDFWLTSDGGDHHAFYLQAPKAIGDPEQRHWNVSIGHATSGDLRNWQIEDDALGPGPANAFDDYTTWTGCVLRHRDRWAMLYTGTSRAERGTVQRIGLATSTDLHTWQRFGVPVLTTDPRWYETYDPAIWHDEAWRDPWAFHDPDDGHVHVLFTARSNAGSRYDRGVIGHARSQDLESWEVLPPLVTPTGFGQLEVPQLEFIDGRWYLLFCSDIETQSPERRRSGPGTGTYYFVAEQRYGPYELIDDGALEANQIGSTYAGRIHRTSDGTPWFIAWNRQSSDGSFIGNLTAPRRVVTRPDGGLSLLDEAPQP